MTSSQAHFSLLDASGPTIDSYSQAKQRVSMRIVIAELLYFVMWKESMKHEYKERVGEMRRGNDKTLRQRLAR